MRGKRLGVILIIVVMMLHGAVGGFVCQAVASVGSYVGVVVGSLFQPTLKADLQAIHYNPFNCDAGLVMQAKSASFYGGVPVFKVGIKRSGSFCVVLMNAQDTNPDDIRHEFGHNVQQLILGPLTFLVTIGLPSAAELSRQPYYDRPWEVTADRFGQVRGRTHSDSVETMGTWYLAAAVLTGPGALCFLVGQF